MDNEQQLTTAFLKQLKTGTNSIAFLNATYAAGYIIFKNDNK